MALQVWLPLLGDLHNQGLDNGVTVTATAQVSVSGCLGSCYSFTASQNITINGIDFSKLSDASISVWVYQNALVNTVFFTGPSTSHYVIAANTNGTSNIYHSGNVGGTKKVYVDGVVGTKLGAAGSWHHYVVTGVNLSSWTGTTLKFNNYSSSYNFAGRVCDIRIYDHCLSAKEVKEISKGLAVHYKLENHMIKNIMSTPTFNTSAAAGGWSHWGGSGHIGSYAQNTDRNYIYGDQPYSHKVADAEGATYNYLLYQSPAYDNTISSAGSRSLVAIIKSQDGAAINDGICYPTWNANVAASGSTINKWTSVSHLGNGFYECRCDGLYQNGSNNLIGIYVRSGQTIYVSSCYVENYSQVAGHVYGPSTDVMEDSSGYGKHGSYISGTVFAVKTKEGGRYASAIENATGYIGKAEVNMPPLDKITFSWWANYKVFGAQTSGLFSTSNVSTDPTDYSTTACNMRDSYFDMCNTAGSCKRLSATGIELNKWHHYCITYDGATERFYVDGVEKSSVAQTGALKDFKYLYISYSKAGGVVRMCRGPVSDFRIYCTALSAADVKEMYETAASVDNKGNFHCYELKEV